VHNAQAIARIYRLGQKSPTYVYRLLYKNTMVCMLHCCQGSVPAGHLGCLSQVLLHMRAMLVPWLQVITKVSAAVDM
jgi:hypothetical protein